jgi:MFS family permease
MFVARALKLGHEPSSGRVWDRQALAIVSIIFLTEAAIATIFFSLVQEYPSHLLRMGHEGAGHGFLRAGAAYTGYALSAYGLTKLPGQPLSGWIADRWGARPTLIVGLASKLGVIAMMALIADPLAFVILCAAYGLTSAVVWPALYAIVGDSYEASSRGRITAGINGAQLAGTALGFAGGVVIIGRAGFGAGFAFAFGCNVLALLLGLVHEPRVGTEPQREAEVRSSPGFMCQMSGLFSALTPSLGMLVTILVLVSVAVSILVPNLRPYSVAVLHMTFTEFALLLSIPAAIAILTLVPSGVVSDRLGRSTPMIVAAGLWTVALFLLTLTRSWMIVLPLASVAAFAYALGLPAWSASLIDMSTAGRRGLQVGIASAIQTVGLAVGPAMGGLLVAHLGVFAPLQVSAAIMAIVLCLSVAYRTRAAQSYLLVQRGAASA